MTTPSADANEAGVVLTEAERDQVIAALYDFPHAGARWLTFRDGTYAAVKRILTARLAAKDVEHDRHRELWAGWLSDAATRGEAAERDRDLLRESIGRLADRLTTSGEKGRQDIGRDEDTWAWVPDQYASELRALLDGGQG